MKSNVLCVSKNGQHYTLSAMGIVTTPAVGDTRSLPVAQILTIDYYDRADLSKKCSELAYMQITLAHEISHTLELEDMYAVEGHATEEGVRCLMENFDESDTDQFCDTILNGESAFCDDCIARLHEVIPDNAYEELDQ